MEGDAGVNQDQMVAQFQAFTGIEDVNECHRVLLAHGWNVEMAVQDALNEQEGIAPVYGHAQETAAEISPAANVGADFLDGDIMRREGLRARGAGPTSQSLQAAAAAAMAADNQRRSANPVAATTWLGWCWNLINMPFQALGNTAWFLARFVFSMFTGLRQNIFLDVPDAEGDVRRFVDAFRQRYGERTPQFLPCSYSQAVRRAKEQSKMLAVYVHNEGHRETDAICRAVLCAEPIVAYLADNLLAFGVAAESPEGRRVAMTLRTWGQPSLCVLVHSEQGQLVCVDRISPGGGGIGGLESQAAVLARLTQAVNAHERMLQSLRQQRTRIAQDRLIREQQELEYNESLRHDRERETKLRGEKEAEQQRRSDKEQRRQRRRDRELDLRRRRQAAADGLPAQPDASEPGAVRLSVRLPDNSRLERRFRDSEPLSTVHAFVFSHDDAPDEFKLQTTFPKRDLVTTGDDVLSFAEAGLGKAAMLVVKDEDVESSSEEDSDEER